MALRLLTAGITYAAHWLLTYDGDHSVYRRHSILEQASEFN